MTVRWITGPGIDALATEDMFFPVVVSTWFGPPTEPLVRGYFAWLAEQVERAQRSNLPLVNITDAGLARSPSAEVRRLIADETKRMKGGQRPVKDYVVIENAVMRGVLNAISWLHGDLRAVMVATTAQAIDAAIRDLAHAGCPAPSGLQPLRWRRPDRVRRSA